jgi:HEAT repeat protein
MRRLLLFLLILALLLALIFFLNDATSPTTIVLEIISAILLVVVIVVYGFGLFRPRRPRPARSQIAEIERLYFRSMREMLNDYPNLAQVINDLQRILSIDPNYKNARHYLNRALILQRESAASQNGTGAGQREDFMSLQERLIDLDPNVRKSVVMELINYGERAIDPLISLLMDPDPDVRVHAATALGWVGGGDAIQPLIVALQDESTQVRRYAARAMCWVVDESAVESLIMSLSDEDSYVRSYAARALGWSQDARAVRPLVELLNNDPSPDVRDYAHVALEDLGQHVDRLRLNAEPTE